MSGPFLVLAALLLTGAAGRAPHPNAPAARPRPAVQTAQRGHGIFSCRLPGGRIATVTGIAGGMVYRYGPPGRPEITILGTPANRKLFHMIAVHGGDWDIQLRFVKGEYSYIVDSFPRNEIVDNVPVSSLTVFRGGKKILERNCSPWAEISLGDIDLSEFPENPRGAPSLYGDEPE
jgi:hypothetical protein